MRLWSSWKRCPPWLPKWFSPSPTDSSRSTGMLPHYHSNMITLVSFLSLLIKTPSTIKELRLAQNFRSLQVHSTAGCNNRCHITFSSPNLHWAHPCNGPIILDEQWGPITTTWLPINALIRDRYIIRALRWRNKLYIMACNSSPSDPCSPSRRWSMIPIKSLRLERSTAIEMYTFVGDFWSMVCRIDNPCLYVNIQDRQRGTKKLLGEKRHAWCWDVLSRYVRFYPLLS